MSDGTARPSKPPSKYTRRVTKWEAAVTRSGVNSEMRRRVLKRDRGMCRYCTNRPVRIEIDHVYPVIYGGKSTMENLVTACRTCNQKKGWSRTWVPIPLHKMPKHPANRVPNKGNFKPARRKTKTPTKVADSKKRQKHLRRMGYDVTPPEYVDNRITDEIRRKIQKRDKPIW